jgi:transcriptional regulator with XRE-family HTH domain
MIDMSDPQVLGRCLCNARKQADLTQEQVADRMDMARTTLIAIEQGKRIVKAHELHWFAEIYGGEIKMYSEEVEKSPLRMISAKKRVMERVFQRTPDAVTAHTLIALQIPTNELERMASTILSLLIDKENDEGEENNDTK